jgi:hypothetical protein
MSDSVSIMIYVNAPPIADVGFEHLAIPFGVPWTFDGSGSYDPDGYIVNYTWDFDNGDYGYGMVVDYMYWLPGFYLVTLTVTDDQGAIGYDSGTVEVIPYLFDNPTNIGNKITKITFKTVSPIFTDSIVNYPLDEPQPLLYPPRPPSNPYPEDGANNVSTDVIFSWTGGEDNPPDTPIITGETNGKVGEEYQYCINPVVDPDGDMIWVFFDWGDDTDTGWLGPYVSGEQVCANHSWDEKGDYTIKARLRDDYGALSDWGYLQVTMPRSRIMFNVFLQYLLEKLPILRYFFRL